MGEQPANVDRLIAAVSEPFTPVVVAEANGFHMKVVRLLGEFPWHVHENEDELFYCTEGSFVIELESGPPVELGTGDVFVVPKGRRHRPVAENQAVTVMFEPAETKQYGD
jgi:mannose-6-phosphate isomerase-like protein (cupin superfamily)